MYAAHKAAGGMTSVYRQIGAGCENLFRAVVQDSLGLSGEQVLWSYEIEKEDKTMATLTLDARIDLAHVGAPSQKPISGYVEWLDRCGKKLGLPSKRIKQLRGAVFEASTRIQELLPTPAARTQTYDSAGNADAQNYLPVLSVISTQASQTVIRRYKNAEDASAYGDENRKRCGQYLWSSSQKCRGLRVG